VEAVAEEWGAAVFAADVEARILFSCPNRARAARFNYGRISKQLFSVTRFFTAKPQDSYSCHADLIRLGRALIRIFIRP
jgi:hypothetical protein